MARKRRATPITQDAPGPTYRSRRKLAGELDNLRNLKTSDATGDSPMRHSNRAARKWPRSWAELDARELARSSAAMARLNRAPMDSVKSAPRESVGRLNALPYRRCASTASVRWKRTPTWSQRACGRQLGEGVDAETRLEDQREVDLSDLEMDISSNR